MARSQRPGRRRGRGLRVIAGAVGGLQLVAPEGASVRPTTDRVKESLFSALGPDVLQEAVALDLYAGTGALGIEALSRGAVRAVFVERDPAALDAITTNLESTRLLERGRVHRGNVSPFLGGFRPPEAPFDLVFLDPPYETDDETIGQVFAALAASEWLSSGATIVVERAGKSVAVPLPVNWQITWERSYGDTLVVVATNAASS